MTSQATTRPDNRIYWRLTVLLGTVVALLTGLVLFAAAPASAQEATVVRVVDGDTVDVDLEGDRTRVRLLNIDTPETVDPEEPEQCLGTEASSYTESLLPAGETVRLQFDQERTDRYGRTLAHVKLSDESFVSDRIAAEGLGVPVVYGPNDDRYDAVVEALERASDEGNGFFDPEISCTMAAQQAAVTSGVGEVGEISEGANTAEAVAAAAAVLTILEGQAVARKALSDTSGMGVRAFAVAGRSEELAASLRSIESAEKYHDELLTVIDERQAEDKAKRKAAAERRAQKQAERKAAADAAAERAAQAPPAPRHTQTPGNDSGSGDSGSSGGSGGDSADSGYTGPRCYAPGGKTWTPC